MNDWLLDPCGWTKPHGPHKYGGSRRDERGQLTIVHPLYCGGILHDPEAAQSRNATEGD